VSKYCINHFNEKKRAKNYVLENEQVRKIAGRSSFIRGVCNRCALNLAKMKITVMPLENDCGERQKILMLFLGKVNNVKQVHTKSVEKVNEVKEILKDHYTNQDKVLSAFEEKTDKLINILQRLKTETRQIFESECERAITETDNLRET